MEDYQGIWFNAESLPSETSGMQCSCEQTCARFLKPFGEYAQEIQTSFRESNLANDKSEIRLLRDKHAAYLVKNIKDLHRNFVSLDASRSWIIYWILHACYLLSRENMISPYYDEVVSTLTRFQNPTGGFGGGPGQLSHGAPTYGSVMSLCTVGTTEALQLINREAMYDFFMSLKDPSGGFCMHKDGEVDTRSTYTTLSVARVLNILTPELTEGVADYLCSCQTYEGGFGGEVDNEAHGGYNFCAMASLLILGEAHRCNLRAVEHWLLNRQMKIEGGFQGRTNKLVDSCYSYWQGAAVSLLEMIKRGDDDLADCRVAAEKYASDDSSVKSHHETATALDPGATAVTNSSGDYMHNQKALQRYILHCAQENESGGLRDKPGKPRDFYHTCYALSGLSVAQHAYHPNSGSDGIPRVFGDADNLLEPTSIVYNIGHSKLLHAVEYFRQCGDLNR